MPCQVRLKKSAIFLCGEAVDLISKEATDFVPHNWSSNRICRDGTHWHVTLLTKDEVHLAIANIKESDSDRLTSQNKTVHTHPFLSTGLKKNGFDADVNFEIFCQRFLEDDPLEGLSTKGWFVLGIGEAHKCARFLVLTYPRAAALRRLFGIPPKDFHITLGFNDSGDMHECSKGIASLLKPQPLRFSVSSAMSKASDLLYAAETLTLGGTPACRNDQTGIEGGRDYEGSESLLVAAEMLLDRRVGLDCSKIGLMTADIDDTGNIEVVTLTCHASLIRCQISGRKGLWDEVIKAADTVSVTLGKMARNMNTIDARLAEMITAHDYWRTYNYCVEASALGYKGFALTKMKRFEEALPCLDRSHRLRSKRRENTPSKQQRSCPSLAVKRYNREAVAVEKALVLCCQRLGMDGPLPPLTKFPRTAHLFNSGGTAVSADDLVVSGDSSLLHAMADGKTRVIVEEKIDGANMGISLSASGKILAQNRSRYISTGDHAQFGPLTAWIEQHHRAIFDILKEGQAGRAASQGLILFGEWVVARHSIPYRRLPGQFVAFDIYDRFEERFYSRSRFHNAMSGSGIPVVPLIAARAFGSFPGAHFEHRVGVAQSEKTKALKSTLTRLLETPSKFRDDGGPVEGVVLRIDENDDGHKLDAPAHAQERWLAQRAKIVRPDFVAGCNDGHWSSRDIEKQSIDCNFAEAYLHTCYPFATEGAARKPFPEEISLHEDVLIKYKDGEPCTETINPRRRVLVTYDATNENQDGTIVSMPRNFSWLWPEEVAISSTPFAKEHVTAFEKAFGISLVVTLTEEEPLPAGWFEKTAKCQNRFVPVRNFMPPSVDQMDAIVGEIVETVRSGTAVLVHCGGGKGRAGTVSACLLSKFGKAGIRSSASDQKNNNQTEEMVYMQSDEAIAEIRRRRPGSIETEAQERFVRDYARLMWRRFASQSSVDTPDASKTGAADGARLGETSLQLTTSAMNTAEHKLKKAETKARREVLMARASARRHAPRYVMLMGLPGSGKSTFANRLASAYRREHEEGAHGRRNESCVVVNQDKLGRKACIALAGRVGRSRNCVILDRCNATEAERAEWMGVLHSPPRAESALVYFAADVETCTSRAEKREGHETIPMGRGGKIIRDMAQKLEPPTPNETKNMFGSIVVVDTFEASDELLRRWGF